MTSPGQNQQHLAFGDASTEGGKGKKKRHRSKSGVRKLNRLWVEVCRKKWPDEKGLQAWTGKEWGLAKHLCERWGIEYLLGRVKLVLKDWEIFYYRYRLREELPNLGIIHSFAESWFPEIDSDHHYGLLRIGECGEVERVYREQMNKIFPKTRIADARWDIKIRGKINFLIEAWTEPNVIRTVKDVTNRWDYYREKFNVISPYPTISVFCAFANTWIARVCPKYVETPWCLKLMEESIGDETETNAEETISLEERGLEWLPEWWAKRSHYILNMMSSTGLPWDVADRLVILRKREWHRSRMELRARLRERAEQRKRDLGQSMDRTVGDRSLSLARLTVRLDHDRDTKEG
jgi:hypothetical protein